MAAPLVSRSTGDVIPADDHNDVMDYIEDGTYRVNALSLSLGGTEVITSALALTNITGDITQFDSGVLTTARGGTGIAFFTAAGPSEARIYTFPDAAVTILYSGGALGTPSGGTLTNCDGTAASLNIGGVAATATALADARTIGGVSFDGTANITVESATGSFAITEKLTVEGATITQTTTTGNTGWFYRNLASASTNSPVMFIENDNAGDDQPALTIQQDGTGNGIKIDQNGNGIALEIDSESASHAMLINSASTGDYAVSIETSKFGLEVKNAGTGTGLFIDQNGNGIALKIDSESTTNGDIEMSPRTSDPSSPANGEIWYRSS